MKRYLLFGYMDYNEHGGANDFQYDFDTIQEASEQLFLNKDEYNVLDTKTGKIEQFHGYDTEWKFEPYFDQETAKNKRHAEFCKWIKRVIIRCNKE